MNLQSIKEAGYREELLGDASEAAFSDARASFTSIVRKVSDEGQRVYVTRFGKPTVAIVPINDLLRLMELDLQTRQKMADDMRADLISDAEVEPFVLQHNVAKGDESEDDILRAFVEKIAELELTLPALKELAHNSMQHRPVASSDHHFGSLSGEPSVADRQRPDVTAPA